jgi:DNA mismatch endonuclease (patch repair protein)
MDNVAPAVRSRTMAAVRSAGNRSTERILRAHLVQRGLRGWRLNARDLPGCPDFVFDRARLAVFVDGCFWHGCPRCHRAPGSNRDYWTQKVDRNRKRDRKVACALRAAGWTVLRVWEHDLAEAAAAVAKRIAARVEPRG